jgi:hypothetical protein
VAPTVHFEAVGCRGPRLAWVFPPLEIYLNYDCPALVSLEFQAEVAAMWFAALSSLAACCASSLYACSMRLVRPLLMRASVLPVVSDRPRPERYTAQPEPGTDDDASVVTACIRYTQVYSLSRFLLPCVLMHVPRWRSGAFWPIRRHAVLTRGSRAVVWCDSAAEPLQLSILGVPVYLPLLQRL